MIPRKGVVKILNFREKNDTIGFYEKCSIRKHVLGEKLEKSVGGSGRNLITLEDKCFKMLC